MILIRKSNWLREKPVPFPPHDTNLTLFSMGQKLGHHDTRLVTNQRIMDNLFFLTICYLSFFQEKSTSVWCEFFLTFTIKEFSSEIICLDNKGKWHHKHTSSVGPSENMQYKMNKFYPVSIHEYQYLSCLNWSCPTNCSSKRATAKTPSLKLRHIYQVKQDSESRNFVMKVQKPT